MTIAGNDFVNEFCDLHNLPNRTNAEKMKSAKQVIDFYDSRGVDWVHAVTYVLAWDTTARGCPFCGRRCF